MKFAIISDSHDNWPNIEKAILYIKKQGITTLVHCGDISSPMVLAELVKLFGGTVHAITGNVSASLEELQEKVRGMAVTLYDETGTLELGGLKIAFNHYPDEAKKIAASGQYDLVFYGHTHKPWDERIGNTRMLNPGTVAGLFSKATFAIYDTTTRQAELVILEKI